MSNQPKFPQVEVQLSGEDGNAFTIIAKVRAALREALVAPDEINRFQLEAIGSRSYDELLQYVMRTVTVL